MLLAAWKSRSVSRVSIGVSMSVGCPGSHCNIVRTGIRNVGLSLGVSSVVVREGLVGIGHRVWICRSPPQRLNTLIVEYEGVAVRICGSASQPIASRHNTRERRNSTNVLRDYVMGCKSRSDRCYTPN